MEIKYIFSILSISMLIGLNIYILINKKSIQKIEERLNESGVTGYKLISPFFEFLYKNQQLANRLISTKLKIILRNQYGDLFLYFNITNFASKKIMYSFYLICINLMIYPIINNSLIFTLIFIFIIFINLYFDFDIKIKYLEYNNSIKNNLPNVISRMSLLIQSGIPTRECINIVSHYEKEESYLNKINTLVANGISENEAYNSMISRSDDILIRKFLSILLQNLEKGSNNITDSLDLLRKESDEFRRNNIIIKTQAANRKLLIPNIMVFIGIMVMIMVPILLNIL